MKFSYTTGVAGSLTFFRLFFPSCTLEVGEVVQKTSTLFPLICALQFLEPHVLVFALLCISAVESYIVTCVPFQIMPHQLNLPPVDSKQGVEILQR